MRVHTHHLRGTRAHFDWSANGDGLCELEPAESIQREPVSVIRSIPIRDIVTAFIVFGALALVAGGVMAMGGGQ